MSLKTVEVGVLTKPQGLKGEIRVHYYADSLDCLQGDVFLQAGHAPPRAVRVRSCRWHQGSPVLLLEGISDRTAAEALRGQRVLVSHASLPPLDDEELYLNDLLGLTVIVEGAAAPLGILENVMFQAEQETWIIVTPDGREVFLPAVPAFVADINLDAERITITPPEGLLELYLD